MVYGDNPMNWTRLCIPLIVLIAGATSAGAEQWLYAAAQDAKVLGFRNGESKFKTCNGIQIDLSKIGKHSITDATVLCTDGGRINRQQKDLEIELKRNLERPLDDSVYLVNPAKKTPRKP